MFLCSVGLPAAQQRGTNDVHNEFRVCIQAVVQFLLETPIVVGKPYASALDCYIETVKVLQRKCSFGARDLLPRHRSSSCADA